MKFVKGPGMPESDEPREDEDEAVTPAEVFSLPHFPFFFPLCLAYCQTSRKKTRRRP
jgi:hypothetical protein